MDNPTIQKIWTQLNQELFCGDCTAARLMIWEKETHIGDPPREAMTRKGVWYVVHCDYFKRAVAYPNLLRRCGAHQKKET